jgi:serine/threonine-protein kinase RsbT
VPSLDWTSIRQRADVELFRRLTRDAAREAGLSDEHAAEWALVASELATNLLRHATDGGSMAITRVVEPRRALVIQCRDTGPGITSVSDAMREGFTTGSGLGGGLPTVERFSDSVEIDTSPTGTTIVVTRWLP